MLIYIQNYYNLQAVLAFMLSLDLSLCSRIVSEVRSGLTMLPVEVGHLSLHTHKAAIPISPPNTLKLSTYRDLGQEYCPGIVLF
jgi:hypothetical protein